MTDNLKEFDVKLPDLPEVIHSKFQYFLESGEFLDLTLACKDGSIDCHRLILAACSPYFSRLFLKYPLEKHIVFFLKNTNFSTLTHLVNYLYYGELKNVNKGQIEDLFRTAEELQIPGLDDNYMDVMEEGKEKNGVPMVNGSLSNEDGQKQMKEETESKRTTRSKSSQESKSAKKRSLSTSVLTANDAPKASKKFKMQPKNGTCIDPPFVSVPMVIDADELKEKPSSSAEEASPSKGQNVSVDKLNSPSKSSNRKKYPKETRDSVLASLNVGTSVNECSRIFGVPKQTIYLWKKQEKKDAKVESEDEDFFQNDRGNRHKKAAELAASGTVTVEAAAKQYEISKNTLTNYVSRLSLQFPASN